MPTNHIHTRARAVAVVLAATAAVLGGLATGAAGLEQEGFTLPARETVVKEYPSIPAPEPATVTVGGVVGPDECAALPSCALVKVEVEIPDIDPGDDFSMELAISWPSERISDNNVQPVEQNDLDTYLFDNGQMAEEEGSSGYTEIGSSASSDNPEVIRVFEPLLGTYNLVVQNFNGANQGWTVTAKSIVGDFESPFEALAPPPGGGTFNPNNKPTTTTTTRPTTTTTVATSTTVSIPEGVVLPDDDFESGEFDPQSAALDAAGEARDQLLAAQARSGDSEPPSTLMVVLWMVVVPLALAAGSVLLIARRRGGLRIRRADAGAST